MFLRCTPQSIRIARTSTNRFIHRSILPSSLPLDFTPLSHPGPFHSNASTSNNSTAAAGRKPSATTLQRSQVGQANREKLLAGTPSIQECETALNDAFAQKEYQKASSIIRKLVGLHHLDPTASLTLLHKVLQSDDDGQLSDAAVLDILVLLRSSADGTNLVDPQGLHRTLQKRGHYRPVQDAIVDLLQLQIQDLAFPDGLQYRPPNMVEEIFSMLPPLVITNPEIAFRIFSMLVEQSFIPPEALGDPALLETRDPQLIMLTTLAKASLHWEWSSLVTESIRSLLQIESASNSLLATFIPDMVASLMCADLAPDPTRIKSCLALIQITHPLYPTPDSAIRWFYDTARDCDCGSEAEALYLFSRSESVVVEHNYPPPEGYTIGWLMEVLFKSGRHPHLYQLLAQEVVDKHISLPLHCRPRFITITALTGNVGPATALWERYAVGRDKTSLVGDGGLLVALAQASTTNMRMSAWQRSGMEQGSVDLKRFLRRAVKEFLKVHKPLARASSETLTSYAHVCFMLGDINEGLKILRTLVRWKKIPGADVLDFCLRILTDKDPNAAANLVRDMAKLGGQAK